jgi:hypothetical protein
VKLICASKDLIQNSLKPILIIGGVHPVARVSSNANKPPYATMFGARLYCALTLHVSAPIGGHLHVLCDKIYSRVDPFMSTDPLS